VCEGGELYPLFPTHCSHLLRPGQNKKKKEQQITFERDREEEQGPPCCSAVLPLLPLSSRVVLAISSSTLGRKNKEEQLIEGMHRTEVKSKT
jgi:hypothetical protein